MFGCIPASADSLPVTPSANCDRQNRLRRGRVAPPPGDFSSLSLSCGIGGEAASRRSWGVGAEGRVCECVCASCACVCACVCVYDHANRVSHSHVRAGKGAPSLGSEEATQERPVQVWGLSRDGDRQGEPPEGLR